MSQDRLNGLATLYTHRDISINVNEIIDLFSRKHERRLTLHNLLNSNYELETNDDVLYSELY